MLQMFCNAFAPPNNTSTRTFTNACSRSAARNACEEGGQWGPDVGVGAVNEGRLDVVGLPLAVDEHVQRGRVNGGVAGVGHHDDDGGENLGGADEGHVGVLQEPLASLGFLARGAHGVVTGLIRLHPGGAADEGGDGEDAGRGDGGEAHLLALQPTTGLVLPAPWIALLEAMVEQAVEERHVLAVEAGHLRAGELEITPSDFGRNGD